MPEDFLSTLSSLNELRYPIAPSKIEALIKSFTDASFSSKLPIMNDEKLVAICRHELRLKEDKDIARLIREVKIVQDDSSDTYSRLTKKHIVKAREILSGFMLAWEYVEDLDGSGPGQRFWKGKTSRPDGLIWPENKKKWCAMISMELNMLTYARIIAGVEKIFIELQDYSIIDQQRRKSRLTSKMYKQADADYDPSLPGARSMIRPATQDKQPKNDATPVPYYADLHTLSEENDTAREDTLKAEGHDLGVPQTPRATSRKFNTTTDIVSAERLRDIEVPATMAQESVNGNRQPSPKKENRAPTPSVRGDSSLLLEEQSRTIDRLMKENGDLKLKISLLEDALSRRSDEGVEARSFEPENTKLAEQAFSQKNEAKKVAYNKSHDAESDTQLEASITDESTEESPSEKRALTPPYIPEKGLHQTWPAFGFKSVSLDGARALRGRAVQIDDYDKKSSKTTGTMSRGPKGSRVKANRKQGPAKKYSSTVSAESSEESHIDTQEPEPTRKGSLPSLPKSLLTRRQAARRRAIDSGSSASEDDPVTRRRAACRRVIDSSSSASEDEPVTRRQAAWRRVIDSSSSESEDDPVTRRRAACRRVIDSSSSESEDDLATNEASLSAAPSRDGPAVLATAVPMPQETSANAVSPQ